MEPIRFIHTADLHLDSPFKGMSGLPEARWKQLRDSTFEAFDRLIAYALAEQPDFMLITGDIYDGEDRSIRAQHRFRTGMQQLAEKRIPVFISYGNHDHLDGRWTRFELPDNVHVFGSSVEQIELELQGSKIKIAGFSYPKRHVREAVIEQFPEANLDDYYHIGMLHGSMDGDNSHAVYAPFRKDQLLSKNYDYWALGHIHMRQQLHSDPAIVYPGNIQGRHRNEQGEKGFYEVTLAKNETHLSFVPTSVIIFESMEISCAGMTHMNEVLSAVSEQARQFREEAGAGVIELKFSGLEKEAAALFSGITEAELLETVRETLEADEPFLWVDKIVIQEVETSAELSMLGITVLQELEEWREDDWKDVLKDLYRHIRGSRFLEPLDEQGIEEIKREAVYKIRREMQAGE